MAKALSAKAEQRIEKNFKYSIALKALKNSPKPKSVSRVLDSLPGIYAKAK